MGQKVNPIGIRLGIVQQDKALWFPEGSQGNAASYKTTLRGDLEARKISRLLTSDSRFRA